MKHRSWYVKFLLIAIIAVVRIQSEFLQDPSTCKSSSDDKECSNENTNPSASVSEEGSRKEGIRVVQREELENKTGENNTEIWLSVLGKVFDVSAGKSFYGKGRSYGAFAGTDCTPCYVSGIFTADEAAKHTDEISDAMLPGVLDWVNFYGTHKSYKFVGYLEDPRFYNEEGEPTANLVNFRKRISSIQN
mmetsp:Transcript_18908/g.43248  ORF Transcript_18908/g.43248 Transcript_18908/m.43248 type:complete len:190 (+) Transcript_18908:104-673(+)